MGMTNHNPFNMTALGVQVAQVILTGDISLARSLAGSRAGGRPWNLEERRAIAAACRVAQGRGWPVKAESFF